MPTGAELFVQAAKTLGIAEIFTLVGDHLNEVLAVADREGMRIIDMRHESGVTHAADAYARITRRPSLSLVTGGPGHTNSITGIATAFCACSPVIAVSGSRANAVADRGAFQDIEQVGMVRPVVKWAAQPSSAAQIPFYLGRAYSEANSGRKGPVHLTVPVDLFTAKTETALPVPAQTEASLPASPDDIERALVLLRSAERPVVIAGSGVWWAGAGGELQEFIEATGLPLYTVTFAKGIVPDNHSLCFGYADPALNRASLAAFKEADLFLVVGKRIDYRLALGGARLFSPEARFIQVDIHPQELGLNRRLEVGLCADVKTTLRQMTQAAQSHTWPARTGWLEKQQILRAEWGRKLEETANDNGSPIHPAAFFRELRAAMPADVLYSWDGGDFTHWGRATTPAHIPGGWLRLGPLATIGSALPNAIALRYAYPNQPIVMITGDGSLGFYLAELDTAVRHKLPFVIIVGNDAAWGIEKELQAGTVGGPNVACDLRSTQYDVIMKGFGGEGETIERLEEVAPAVQRAFASNVPYLLNVKIRGVRSPFTEWQIAGKK